MSRKTALSEEVVHGELEQLILDATPSKRIICLRRKSASGLAVTFTFDL